MNVLGLDIGYSNLKCVWGEDGNAQSSCLPVGAGPVYRLGEDFLRKNQYGLRIEVDNEPWAAGIEPARLEGWGRTLHEDYPATKGYQALFYAALLQTGLPKVDKVVTGLPVSQYLDKDKRNALSWMAGMHRITPKIEIEVGEVSTVGQPLGAYVSSAMQQGREKEFSRSRVLVLDVGFFSTDWVLIDHHELVGQFSGTSTQATSVVLEEACELIQQDFGGRLSRERLERAIREDGYMYLFGKEIELDGYLRQAAQNIAEPLVSEIRASLRQVANKADIIVLAGGGASYFKDSFRESFTESETVVPTNPVMVNAQGFWDYGFVL